MRSSSREEIVDVFDALEAGFKRALDLTFDVLTAPERLRVLERWEQLRRWHPAVEHPLINQLAAQADATELGGKLPAVLANRLRISRVEASRRIRSQRCSTARRSGVVSASQRRSRARLNSASSASNTSTTSSRLLERMFES